MISGCWSVMHSLTLAKRRGPGWSARSHWPGNTGLHLRSRGFVPATDSNPPAV